MVKENYIYSNQDENNDYYSNDDIFNFNSWGADLSFRELIQRYEDDELLKPELQRKYIWDKAEASRFIDSVLLKLPIPSIFLSMQPNNEKMLIIDGYQRLMTVYDYVKGIFSRDGKIFKLSNTNRINRRWRGLSFSELQEEEQRRIKNTTIHAIIFVQTHPQEDNTGMYQIFERINTSGRTLYPQEIRNCIYQGDLNKLLIELNDNRDWRELFGLKTPDARMRDIELILRFFTLSSIDFDSITTTSISLKKELNIYMSRNTNIGNDQKKALTDTFTDTIKRIRDRFGTSAFHNLSSGKTDMFTKKFNPTIFDSFMIAFKNCIELRDDFKERRKELLRNEDYQSAIKVRTTNVENIKKRINLVKEYLFVR